MSESSHLGQYSSQPCNIKEPMPNQSELNRVNLLYDVSGDFLVRFHSIELILLTRKIPVEKMYDCIFVSNYNYRKNEEHQFDF